MRAYNTSAYRNKRKTPFLQTKYDISVISHIYHIFVIKYMKIINSQANIR